jgi:hypothetical protein
MQEITSNALGGRKCRGGSSSPRFSPGQPRALNLNIGVWILQPQGQALGIQTIVDTS